MNFLKRALRSWNSYGARREVADVIALLRDMRPEPDDPLAELIAALDAALEQYDRRLHPNRETRK
jgi:hypothetical protein